MESEKPKNKNPPSRKLKKKYVYFPFVKDGVAVDMRGVAYKLTPQGMVKIGNINESPTQVKGE